MRNIALITRLCTSFDADYLKSKVLRQYPNNKIIFILLISHNSLVNQIVGIILSLLPFKFFALMGWNYPYSNTYFLAINAIVVKLVTYSHSYVIFQYIHTIFLKKRCFLYSVKDNFQLATSTLFLSLWKAFKCVVLYEITCKKENTKIKNNCYILNFTYELRHYELLSYCSIQNKRIICLQLQIYKGN